MLSHYNCGPACFVRIVYRVRRAIVCLSLKRRSSQAFGIIPRNFSSTNFNRMCSEEKPLISAKWLREQMRLDGFKDKIRILDATWHLPMFKRDYIKEHREKRIPGARFFDLSECQDKSTELLMMLPKPEEFAKYVGDLAGIENHHHIILYDNHDNFVAFSAVRAWWMFRVFGHNNVSVLEGGLPSWIKEGYEAASGDYSKEEEYPESTNKFKAVYRTELVKDFEFMKENIKSGEYQVMDGRPKGRFLGTDPGPDPAVPSGHLPNEVNVMAMQFFNKESRRFKSPAEITTIMRSLGIDLQKPTVALDGGSGVAASLIGFIAFVGGNGHETAIYDAGWSEWAKKAPELILTEK